MTEAGFRTVALVTGAAQGIGQGIARALALASYKVMFADIESEMAEQSAALLRQEGCEAVAQHLDVTRPLEWELAVATLASRWGDLDLLVNCAGISSRGTVESTDEPLWDRTLGVNLKGAWLGIKTALPDLRRRRGTIINIGSTRATRPMPGLFSYNYLDAGLQIADDAGMVYLPDRSRPPFEQRIDEP
jgi:NAD(P)-dependent dehydrogenase (short-subunit alcohol dehydrogenase family)